MGYTYLISYKSNEGIDKFKTVKVDDIDSLVDNIIEKRSRKVFENKSIKKIEKDNILDKKRNEIIKDALQFFNKKITKRIISGFAVIILIVALLSSSLPQLYANDDIDVIVTLEPRALYSGETVFINVSVPDYYNISSFYAEVSQDKKIDLILIDNTSDYDIWAGSWIVNDFDPGFNIAKVVGMNSDNISYSASVEWKVLEPIIDSENNNSISPDLNLNETTDNIDNNSIQPPIISDENYTNNESSSTGVVDNDQDNTTEDEIPQNQDDMDSIIDISDLIEKSEFGTAEKPINDRFEPDKEIIDDRTFYSKTFREDFGINQKVLGIGPIHYKDDNGDLQDIDTNFILSDDLDFDYEVDKGFYKIKLKKDLSSSALLEYRLDESYFQIEVQDLYWIDNNGEKVLISQPLHTGGVVHGNKVLYSNAFGNGIDVEFLYHPQYFGKHLIINSFDSLPQNSNLYSFLEFNFKMKISDNLDVFIDGQKLYSSEISTSNIVEFRDKSTGETIFIFNEPYCIDSQGNTNPVILSIRKNGSEIILSKRIDKSWLESAVFPVIVDPVSTIYLEGDTYDMYDQDGTNVDNDADVQIGRSGSSHWDAYWAFPITSDIITGTINSVTFTGYVSTNDINVNPTLYGLQQEDCPALEGAATPNTYTRTTASYTWALNGAGTGSKTTGDMKSVFNEWISDYTHSSPPDRFGIVIDDTGAGNGREVYFYDYSHGSYSSHTYLTINYTERDWNPPTPDPLTWVTEPYNASSSSITMVATTASDNTTPISYYFNETTGNSGATDSGWQAGTSYTDTGLSENTQYAYEVRARDSNSTPNVGNYSTLSYEYTDVDAPTDNELTFLINTSWINATVAQPPNPSSGSTGSYFNWVTGGASNSGWQTGVYFHNRTGLNENTQYGALVRYRNGDGDVTIYNPTEKTNYTYCEPPTDGEFTIDGYGSSYINMSVLHPTNPTTGNTAAYFDCVTGGASDSGWITDSDSGRYYYNITGLEPSTTYGFRVKYRNADVAETIYTIEKQQTTEPPQPEKPTVLTNESTDIEENNATLHGFLQNNGTFDTICYFLWGNQNPPTDNNVSQGTIAHKSEFSYDTSLTGQLSKGTLYYFDTKAYNTQGWDESGLVKTFLTKPDPPSSFNSQSNNSNIIYLSWQKGTGANRTYIERNTSSSWTLGQGTLIYNDSGTNYENSGLSAGTTYYYQAWSYTNWSYDSSTLFQWSDTNVGTNNKTNSLPTITNEIPANGSTGISPLPQMSIDVNDNDGQLMTVTWRSNSSGSWQIFGVNNSVGNGTYYQTNSNFSDYFKTYYWNVTISDGIDTNISGIYYFSTSIIDTYIDPIYPYITTNSPLIISATDGTDIDNITLYYRWSQDNQSWDNWNTLTYDDFESGFGSYTDGGGDCELYTGGTYAHQGTNAAEIQDDSGTASSFYHTSGIDVQTPGYTCIRVDFWFQTQGFSGSYDFFVEYFDGTTWQQAANFVYTTDFVNSQFYNKIVWINETSFTFPTNMQIRFRCDSWTNNEQVYIDQIYVNATTQSSGGNGINWSVWSNANNPDEDYPWSWNFDFPNSTGYYQFYSIGKKSGSPDESAPAGADAICRFNRLPTITNEVPNNISTNIQLIPQMSVNVNDMDGDMMILTWYSNSSGSWQIFGTNNSVANGTYYQTNNNFSNPGTIYWWNLSVYDGVHTNNSGIFYFTTSYNPDISNPGPSNTSTAQYTTPACNITVSDPDGGTLTVRFYENTTGSWVLQQTNSSVSVTNPTNVIWTSYTNATLDNTTYWWLVNISDGKGCYDQEIYHFRTANTSIEITPDSWNQGVLLVGSSNETTGFYFNLTNNGDAPLYIQIKASNATNATTGDMWKLNSTPALDNFSLQYNKSSGGTWTNINLTYDIFISSLNTGSWQNFDLKLIMATLSSTVDPMSMSITIRSVKA